VESGAVSPNPVGDRFERLAQSIAERVVNLVLDAIDLNAVVDKIDIDKVVAKVDIDEIIDRVDINKVIARVDMNAVLDQIDLNAVMGKIDIDSLVENTEIGSIIAKSTTGILTEVLDVVRSQGVGLDDFVARWTNRILRRDPNTLPVGPPLLVAPTPPIALPPGRNSLAS
jgi:hypothetical protein